jgi:hypothetical protein
MPVAVAPIDRKPRPVLGQLTLKGGDQLAILRVKRADAAEALIVLGDVKHALTGDVPAAENVFEKRQNVIGPFGAAEGDDEDGIVR